MENFYTMSEFLRQNLLNYYHILNKNFYEKNYNNRYDEEPNDDLIDIDDVENYYLEKNDLYESDVICEIIDKIEHSKYREFYYLIIFKDVWEYLKTKQLIEASLLEYEKEMIEFLENNNIKNIFNKLDESSDFDLDLITLFLGYHYTNDKENRIKNRKLIELTNNSKYLDKFKISILDDIEYQYTKTRKIR